MSDKSAAWNRRVHHRKMEYLRSIKASSPCADCGIQYHFSVLEFDHVRGEKKFALSKAGTYGRAMVDAEIAKCEVVCANCHRERTWRRQQWSSPKKSVPPAAVGNYARAWDIPPPPLTVYLYEDAGW